MTPEQQAGAERLTNDVGCAERPLATLDQLRSETLFGESALADLLHCDPSKFEAWKKQYSSESTFLGKDLNLIGRIDAVAAVTDVLRSKRYPDKEISRVVFEDTISETLTLADIIKGPAPVLAREVASQKIAAFAGSPS